MLWLIALCYYKSTVFAQYLLILTDPGLLRSGTRLHWFVAVVLLILEDLFTKDRHVHHRLLKENN